MRAVPYPSGSCYPSAPRQAREPLVMKSHIADLVSQALAQLVADRVVDGADLRAPAIERTREDRKSVV